MLPYHVPADLACNEQHPYLYTRFGYIYSDFLTFPYQANSQRFPWPNIRNLQNLDHVHQVCAERYAVPCMIICTMTIVIQLASHWVLTSASMTRMTSLTYILLVSFISNLVFIVWLTSNGQDNIRFIGCQSMRFEVESIGIASLILAHAYANCYVWQFGYWTQVNPHT